MGEGTGLGGKKSKKDDGGVIMKKQVAFFHILLIHPSVHRHMSCFHLLASVNNAAINMSVQGSLWTLAFTFGVSTRSKGIYVARPYSNSISNFFEEPPYCLPQRLHHFTFPPAVHRCSVSTHPHQHLLFCVWGDGFAFLLGNMMLPYSNFARPYWWKPW